MQICILQAITIKICIFYEYTYSLYKRTHFFETKANFSYRRPTGRILIFFFFAEKVSNNEIIIILGCKIYKAMYVKNVRLDLINLYGKVYTYN